MAKTGASNILELIDPCQGRVFPPIIAKVSMAAAGATAVKKEL